MIIKFYTEGCQPCKAVSSVLNSNEIDYDEIDIGKDIEDYECGFSVISGDSLAMNNAINNLMDNIYNFKP